MTTPLSPEAQQLNDTLGRIFAQVREALKPSAEAFKKLGEPRWTWDEIQVALENASDKQCYYDFSRADLLKDVREELTRARVAKL